MAETQSYHEVFSYIRNGQYPEDIGKDKKRSLRRKAQKLVLNDGMLYYTGCKDGQPRRWVHDAEEQTRIITACHSDKLAGHFGRDKTRDKVCENCP